MQTVKVDGVEYRVVAVAGMSTLSPVCITGRDVYACDTGCSETNAEIARAAIVRMIRFCIA